MQLEAVPGELPKPGPAGKDLLSQCAPFHPRWSFLCPSGLDGLDVLVYVDPWDMLCSTGGAQEPAVTS